MKNFIHEIHRRSLWQVLGIYLAVSWVVLQVVDVVGNNFGLPEWVAPAALILLLIGLPIVVATAFVQEGMTTGGERQRGSVEVVEPAAGEPAGTISSGSGGGGLLTWRNALLGGMGAFALLGIGTATFIAMRTAGVGPAGTLVAKGVMEEREEVMVADFQSPSGDVELASAATEAFRIDLSQSPVVSVVDRSRMADLLVRMGREADDEVTPDVAREAAQRGGINAVVLGQIDAAGRGFVLTARLVATADGAELASRRATASDSSEVIQAIDDLSQGLRERIGESLGSIARTPSLEQVATASLRALRLYTQAENAVVNLGDTERGLALLEGAIEEDSTFAMAWRKLGIVRGNEGLGLAGVKEALDEAYAFRDRLPDRDRYLTEAQYHNARGERDRAIIAYETLLEIDPSEGVALNNLGIITEMGGDRETAYEMFERARATGSDGLYLFQVARSLQGLGRFDEADARLAELREEFPDYAAGPFLKANIAAARGDFVTAEAAIDELVEQHGSSRSWLTNAALLRGGIMATQGRISEALSQLAEARDLELERGLPARYLLGACDLALVRLMVAGHGVEALSSVEDALERVPLEGIETLDRPYVHLATVYALAGDLETARGYLARFEDEIPPDARGSWNHPDHFFARGEIALADGQHEEAARYFEQAGAVCRTCALPRQAAAEVLVDAEAGIESFEAFASGTDAMSLGTRVNPWFPYGDWVTLGPSYERFAGVYDELGDLQSAAKYYAAFVELWRDADEELRPRVQAAQARLEAILAEIG